MPPQPATRAKAPPKGGGKQIMGLPRTQFFTIGGIGVGLIVAFVIWRKKKKSSSPAAAASAGGCPDGSAPDASGNCPQTGTDLAGELATLQTEIADLQGNQGAGGGGSGGGGTGSTGTGGGSAGSGSSAGTGTAGGTSGAAGSTPGTSGGSWHYPAPSGLHSHNVSATGYQVSWNPVTGPSGQKPGTYTVATYDSKGSEVDQFSSGATTTREYGRGGKGLPKGTYHTNVWANGGPQAPPHSTVYVTLTK